jgi:fatty acid desaturase
VNSCALQSQPRQVPRGDPRHRLLLAEVARAGCFRPATARTVLYGCLVVLSYAAAYATLLAAPGPAVRILAIAALAFVSVHCGFIAHEAGHGAITRDRRKAAWVGQVFNTLLTALSCSHFNEIHSRHHPHCNERACDPDMQSSLFSMYPQAAVDKTGLGKVVSRYQAVLIWVLVWLQGFSLKVDSVRHLRNNPRTTRIDQVVMLLHVALWTVPPVLFIGLADALLNYALMTLLIGPYLGMIFLVNHIGTRVIEPGETLSFFSQELAVTRNLGSSRASDFVFGGLNNHIEHHLFPSMPTAHLPKARRITRSFCQQHCIAYQEMSWFAAAREVTRHFKAMSAWVPPASALRSDRP